MYFAGGAVRVSVWHTHGKWMMGELGIFQVETLTERFLKEKSLVFVDDTPELGAGSGNTLGSPEQLSPPV